MATRVRIQNSMLDTAHPAPFRDSHIPLFAEILEPLEIWTILDPFAGIGKIHGLRDYGYETRGIELEPEWAMQGLPWTVVGSVLDLHKVLMRAGWPTSFDACLTSPSFGNRLADHHEAKDSSVRNTYRHKLGRPLSEGSSAGLQWGPKYREFHEEAWSQVTDVVQRIFILHIKDHVRKGEVMPVSQWHAETLEDQGWKLRLWRKIDAPGNRHGENHQLRVDHESVLFFERER